MAVITIAAAGRGPRSSNCGNGQPGITRLPRIPLRLRLRAVVLCVAYLRLHTGRRACHDDAAGVSSLIRPRSPFFVDACCAAPARLSGEAKRQHIVAHCFFIINTSGTPPLTPALCLSSSLEWPVASFVVVIAGRWKPCSLYRGCSRGSCRRSQSLHRWRPMPPVLQWTTQAAAGSSALPQRRRLARPHAAHLQQRVCTHTVGSDAARRC